MKYRIKNPDIEKAVRGLFKTQEAYEKALFETCAKQLHDPYILMNMPISSKDSLTGGVSTIGLLKMDIEEVVEYDPNGWNEMCVLPPANGQFLVYCKSDKWFSIWHRYEDHWRNGNWPIFYDNDGDEDLKYFKYRSLDFLKEDEEE